MHVLVCDDDKDVGGFLRTLFDLEGWETALVTSGEDCLAVVAGEEPPDALVLDQLMPGLTGIETADELRSRGFERPIILCSGHLGPELAGDIKRLDLIPCNKIDLEALVRIVRSAAREGEVIARRKSRKKPTRAGSVRPSR
jgi:CheY-like chemotaxis protein